MGYWPATSKKGAEKNDAKQASARLAKNELWLCEK